MTGAPVVACDGLGKTYAGEAPVEALRDATFVVERGEQVALCGPSGSGKSTLLHILGLLDSPTEGTYRLLGVDTAGLDEARRAGLRAAALGFVFQSFHLLPGRTSAENVALGMAYQGWPRHLRARTARAVLDRVGLGHRADADATTLSGGERQRVAIARAIAHGPELLFADEPTGNLDSVTGAVVLDLLADLNADGYTQVIVTHDPDVAARTGRRLDVLDGEVRHTGASR